MTIRRTLGFIAIVILLMAVGAGIWWGTRQGTLARVTTDSPNASTSAIRIAGLRVLSGLPLYVALQDRMFERAGWVAKFDPFDSSDLVANQIRDDAADLAFCALSAALQVEAARPDTLRIVAITYSSTCLIAAKEDGPTTIAEIHGKNMGVWPGSTFSEMVSRCLAVEGLSPDAYSRKPLPPGIQVDRLGAEVQVLFTLEPIGAQAVSAGRGRYLTQEDLFSKHFLGGIDKKFPGGCICLSRRFARENPAVVKAMMVILQQAVERTEATDFQQQPYLKQFTLLGDADVASLHFEGWAVGDRIDVESTARLARLLTEWRQLPAAIDVKRVLAP